MALESVGLKEHNHLLRVGKPQSRVSGDRRCFKIGLIEFGYHFGWFGDSHGSDGGGPSGSGEGPVSVSASAGWLWERRKHG